MLGERGCVRGRTGFSLSSFDFCRGQIESRPDRLKPVLLFTQIQYCSRFGIAKGVRNLPWLGGREEIEWPRKIN